MTRIDEKYETKAHKVRAFIANELAVPPESVNLTSRLRQDLKIDGADAADILEAFALSFDVDDSAFRANDYFGTGAGGFAPVPGLEWVLWFFGNGRPLKTLTVADLVRAVEKGYLK